MLRVVVVVVVAVIAVKMTAIKMVCLYFAVLLALCASAVRAHMNLYLNQYEVMRLLGEC